MQDTIHKSYPFISSRKGVWNEIARYISKDCASIGTLLELAPGFCDFVNQFPAKRKICIEHNSSMKKYAAHDVEFHCDDATLLNEIATESIDLVFASNFFEHLNSTQLDTIMPRIHQSLRKHGRLVLIQPNYRLCQEHYFDDETHQTIFSDKNIADFLNNYNLRVIKIIPGLLPFSMKSRLPKLPILTRLYLNSPIRPLAAQMYVVAEKI